MKTIEFNKNKYIVPESWKEVSVKQQIEAHRLSQNEKYVKAIGVLSAYTNIPVEDLKKAKTPMLLETMKHLAFINTPISSEPLFEFEYKGDKYNVVENIMQQQFQDFIALQTAIAEYKDDYWKQLTFILAIMAKKKGETLDSYDVTERASYLEDIDVETVNRVAAFFLSSKKALRLISALSSPQAQGIILQSKSEELSSTLSRLKTLRGGNLLIRLWIFVSRLWLRFYMRQWEKRFNSQHSSKPKKSWKQTYKKLLSKMQKRNNQ